VVSPFPCATAMTRAYSPMTLFKQQGGGGNADDSEITVLDEAMLPPAGQPIVLADGTVPKRVKITSSNKKHNPVVSHRHSYQPSPLKPRMLATSPGTQSQPHLFSPYNYAANNTTILPNSSPVRPDETPANRLFAADSMSLPKKLEHSISMTAPGQQRVTVQSQAVAAGQFGSTLYPPQYSQTQHASMVQQRHMQHMQNLAMAQHQANARSGNNNNSHLLQAAEVLKSQSMFKMQSGIVPGGFGPVIEKARRSMQAPTIYEATMQNRAQRQ